MAVDTKLTKTPYKKEKYTEQQIHELALCSTDPKHFMKEHCYIQHPTKGRMKFAVLVCLHDKQVKVLVQQDTCYGMQCLIQIKLF